MWPFTKKAQKTDKFEVKIDTSTYIGKLKATRKSFKQSSLYSLPNGDLKRTTNSDDLEIDTILNNLTLDLVEMGEKADEKNKVEAFKKAVIDLNNVNKKYDHSLIETDERETLCEIINDLSVTASIEPKDYGDGEGLASEWRDW